MSNQLSQLFQDVADAIRNKTGDTATMKPTEFADKIAGINIGTLATVLEGIEIPVDFSNGDQTITAEDGTLVKSATIKKPDTLTPANIAKGVTIAGIVGEHEGGEGGTVAGTFTVKFCDYEGTELYSRLVFDGDDCPDPVEQNKIETPTRDSTEANTYTFNGWSDSEGGSADTGALLNITADRTVYAAYKESVRYYTVNFWNGETLHNTQLVAYGSNAVVPSTAIEGYYFAGWDKDPTTLTIVENTDFYGTWELDEGWLVYRGTLTGLTGTATYSSGDDAKYVYDIRYTPDGTRMVAATNSNLYLYDATTTPYTLLETKSTGTSNLQTGFDISPDGTELVVGKEYKSTSISNSLTFYSITDTGLVYSGYASGSLSTASVLYAPRYSHDGTKLAVWANEQKGVAIFTKVSEKWTLDTEIPTERSFYLYNEYYAIDLAFSPDDTLLSAVCGRSYQNVAHGLFDMTTYTDVTGDKSVGHLGTLYRTAWSPSGDWLVIGGSNYIIGTSQYYAIRKIALSGEGKANERTMSNQNADPFDDSTHVRIYGMEFSPNGEVLLMANYNNPYLLGINIENNSKLDAPSTMPADDGRSIAVSPDGKVAFGTDNGTIFTYKLRM